jgi:serine/threonine-protein kinase
LGSIVGGKYRLLKRIGEGGHGRVYRAVNILLGREVAVKVLKPELIADEVAKKRFFREAKVANKIRHPNVVDVIDVGDSDEGPWMVQELLSGEAFSVILQREKRLSISRTIDTLLPALSALSAAHAKGIAHRDFKPENIFLVRDENGLPSAKILDFGLSKGTVTFGTARDSDRVTATGVVVGTPAYLSPERVRMENDGDVRGDVWSIGVVLYESVSGDLPFAARNVREMFVQIGSIAPILLEDMLPSVDAEYARIVGKCLKRDPNERYASAGEIEHDLTELRRSPKFTPPQGTARPALSSNPPPWASSGNSIVPAKDAWGEDISVDSLPPPSLQPRPIHPTPLELHPEELLADSSESQPATSTAQPHATPSSSEQVRAGQEVALSQAIDAHEPSLQDQPSDETERGTKWLPVFVAAGCLALIVVGWFATTSGPSTTAMSERISQTSARGVTVTESVQAVRAPIAHSVEASAAEQLDAAIAVAPAADAMTDESSAQFAAEHPFDTRASAPTHTRNRPAVSHAHPGSQSQQSVVIRNVR